jgi:hypothetical protein
MEWTTRSPPLASAVRESVDSRSLLSAAVSLTRFQIPLYLPCFRASVLQLDALLPSAGSGAATVPRLHRYYGGAKTSRCPSRRASLPSLGDTMSAPVCSLLCFFGCPSAQAWTLVPRCPSGSPVMETTRPPRFLGRPLHQARQACYRRDHPVNHSELTKRERQPVTALTVIIALHRHPSPQAGHDSVGATTLSTTRTSPNMTGHRPLR